jgi:hypothetical protein
MSLVSFLVETLETQKDEVEKISEFERLLKLLAPREEPQIYLISVTSNW